MTDKKDLAGQMLTTKNTPTVKKGRPKKGRPIAGIRRAIKTAPEKR